MLQNATDQNHPGETEKGDTTPVSEAKSKKNTQAKVKKKTGKKKKKSAGKAPAGTARSNDLYRSRPVLGETLTLSSGHAQRIFRRTYPQVSRDLFFIEVSIDQYLPREQSDEIPQVVFGMIEKVKNDMGNDISQAQVLISENNISQLVNYTEVETVTAEINCGYIREYLSLIKTMDKLLQFLDTLWLHGIIDPLARKRRAYEWQRRMYNTANRIRGINERIRHERKKRNDEEGSDDTGVREKQSEKQNASTEKTASDDRKNKAQKTDDATVSASPTKKSEPEAEPA